MKRLILLIIAVLIVQAAHTQVPDKFNYQAVVRNDMSEILSEQDVQFKLSILANDATGQPVYSETHNVTTSPLGIVNLIIGTGSSRIGILGAIDWGVSDYFLKVELDPTGGASYRDMGTSQLISVPYAMFSGAVNQPMSKFTVMADNDHAVEEALFEVKDQFGNTLFAVYPEGTRVYVDDSDGKGIKGGFAVGGYNKTKGMTNEYFRITPDSIRMYIEEPVGKGIKGGFAVGGYNKLNKGEIIPHFFVSSDSTEVYVNDPVNGGFNVKLNDPQGKGSHNEILSVNAENSYIGFEAGYADRSGKYNSYLGYRAGYHNISGSNNVYLGNEAGYGNMGNHNIFIGNQAGMEELGDDRLYIENGANDLNGALIYGEFDTDKVRINNSLGIGRNATDYNLEVEGSAYKTDSETWLTTSDSRVKTNIRNIENAREQIMRLRPVSFEYNEYWKARNPGVKDKTYYNFIAQEFKEVFPDAVQQSSELLEGDDENLYLMSNTPAIIVSVKAVQELIEENREQQIQIEELKKEVLELADMKTRLEKLEQLMGQMAVAE